jgi:UDP-N-acetylglucosamine:LPS N-acetylglucosamine transferase
MIYSWTYRFLVTSPRIARIFGSLLQPAERSLRARFDRTDVRAVIALHPAAVIATGRWRATRRFYFYTVCTDLVVHGLHHTDNVERIFCDKRATNLLDKDAAAGSAEITYSGLPTAQPSGVELCASQAALLSFDILVSFGAKGILADRYMRDILRCVREKQLSAVIICGTNGLLRELVESLIREFNLGDMVKCYGYIPDLAPLMHRAKIIIGKPGGITTGEALYANKAFVVVDRLPGQEEFNLKVLIESGLGFFCGSQPISVCIDEALDYHNSRHVLQFRNKYGGGVSAISDVICSDLRTVFFRSNDGRP